jgi:hypothetical protein
MPKTPMAATFSNAKGPVGRMATVRIRRTARTITIELPAAMGKRFRVFI